MPRCKCGKSVSGSDGSVAIREKKTGRLIKVICAECASHHRPKVVCYKDQKDRSDNKYNAWRNYPVDEALPEE